MANIFLAIWALAGIIILAAVGIAINKTRKRIRDFSKMAFGTASLADGLKQQQETLQSTPKSISDMTRLCLPQIEKDFPEFSWQELKQRSERQLAELLEAIEAQDLSKLREASGELKRQTRLWIESDREQGIHEQFDNIIIHQTGISRYTKSSGSCSILLQSAVEYRYAQIPAADGTDSGAKSDNRIAIPDMERRQTRYEMEWLYIQDADQFPAETRALSVNCPNCGAPVKNLGAKSCEYCGSSIEPLNIRVWALDRIEECR